MVKKFLLIFMVMVFFEIGCIDELNAVEKESISKFIKNDVIDINLKNYVDVFFIVLGVVCLLFVVFILWSAFRGIRAGSMGSVVADMYLIGVIMFILISSFCFLTSYIL